MATSVLSQILQVIRHRRRSDPRGGFSPLLMYEDVVEEDATPILVTNSRGKFIRGKLSATSILRAAFFECSIEDEGVITRRLYETLSELSVQCSWATRCTSVQEASARLASSGLEPKSIVLPYASLPALLGTEAAQAAPMQGFVATIDTVRVFAADLPPQGALVFGEPLLTGLYIRAGDYVGIAILRADRAVMVVA